MTTIGLTISEPLAGSGLCDQLLGDLSPSPIPTFGVWSGCCRDSFVKVGQGGIDLKTGEAGAWRLCAAVVDANVEREFHQLLSRSVNLDL